MEQFTFFFGKKSPFSQFYPCQFTVDGVTYNCAEQYMMHQKALLFGDDIMARMIMATDAPLVMKQCGRKVTPFDPMLWSKHSMEIVTKGNLAKFSQNPELLAALFATAGTTLVEAAPRDKIWGIGMGSSNPDATDRKKWRGKNQLGEILTRLRIDLMLQQKNR